MSRRTLMGVALLAPLLLLLALNFLFPIGMLLLRGIEDGEVAAAWPQTVALLSRWDEKGLPSDAVADAFVRELPQSIRSGLFAAAANRLNSETAGWRTALWNTATAVSPGDRNVTALEQLRAADARWNKPESWMTIKRASGHYTDFYLLAALDLARSNSGAIERMPRGQSVFVESFARTFEISALVTLLCALLGYPLAYLIASLPPRKAHILLILVLLPLWISVLVRTTAWMVLLQSHGVVNEWLLRVGVISHPLRLIYNRLGVYLAMTHVLLPYMILPLYALMRGLSLVSVRAALSLGGTPSQTFRAVYFPQTLPGLVGGSLIVFILSLGYYITPTLIGGPGDQMISSFIAFYTNQSLDWGRAAALSFVLLVATLLLVTMYARFVGDRGALAK